MSKDEEKYGSKNVENMVGVGVGSGIVEVISSSAVKINGQIISLIPLRPEMKQEKKSFLKGVFGKTVDSYATIVSIQFHEIRDMPDVNLCMLSTLILAIQTEDGTRYETNQQVNIPFFKLPLFEPGKKLQVRYYKSDPTRIIIDSGYPVE
ncbi:MAG: hypothetical protein FWG14_13920 [Peptococcaceae bacterium]|nr:hypothetical protein [Peptococcaceae bacterium]